MSKILWHYNLFMINKSIVGPEPYMKWYYSETGFLTFCVCDMTEFRLWISSIPASLCLCSQNGGHICYYPIAVLIGGQRLQMMRGPPIAPPLPRPPPPPPMMLPPPLQGQTPQGASQPIQNMAAAPQVRPHWSMSVCVHILLYVLLWFC